MHLKFDIKSEAGYKIVDKLQLIIARERARGQDLRIRGDQAQVIPVDSKEMNFFFLEVEAEKCI